MMNLFKMSLTLCVLALALDLIFQVSSQDSPQDFLDAHNAARKDVGVPPMNWDNVLEAHALNYSQGKVDNCKMELAVGPSGQNLVWRNNDLSGADAVKLWVDERNYYNLESGACATGKICGHYTQVIWINSTQLGCAKVRCSNNGTFIACYYDPPGNIPGKRPTEGIESLSIQAVAPSPQNQLPGIFPPKESKNRTVYRTVLLILSSIGGVISALTLGPCLVTWFKKIF